VNWKILDVGSGTGEKLLALKRIGFKNILGIDPHLERDIYYKNGLTILKKSLFEIEGKFDLLLFNHSLEHMEDPVSILKEAKQKMKDESILVLRVPLAGCFAWQKYGTFWDGLDAPRHIFIPTKKSINILAERNKFEIINEYCDSTSMQFWASEQYQKGISLTDPRSYSINPKKSIFTKRMINNFSREAEKLNEEGKGDIACFALKKIKTS
jgi:SAM-dependent methyltransferase